jgi:hypothetical protein
MVSHHFYRRYCSPVINNNRCRTARYQESGAVRRTRASARSKYDGGPARLRPIRWSYSPKPANRAWGRQPAAGPRNVVRISGCHWTPASRRPVHTVAGAYGNEQRYIRHRSSGGRARGGVMRPSFRLAAVPAASACVGQHRSSLGVE